MANPPNQKAAIRAGYVLAGFPAAFALAALLVQFQVGAYATDRGQTGDEAAHFVTSLMLVDYLRHLGTNPIAFARDYYAHLPRVAFGHWPPFFELLQTLTFAIFGGTNTVAMALQAAIAGLLAGLPAALMARRHGLAAGILTGLVILCGRFVLFLIDTAMADNLLGLLVFLSAWSWSRFYARPSPWSAAAFAAAVTAAILTKGSAIGLLALPLVYVTIRRDWGFLLRRWTVIAFAVILVLTIPWYAATYRMAATGWNYSWGNYTLVAAPYFAKALFSDFGIPCTLGFLFGAARAIRRRDAAGPDMTAFAATAFVQFLFILLVPVDLQLRYLVPFYPCAAMVAVWGLWGFFETVLPARSRRPALAGALTTILVLLSIWQSFSAPHVESFRTRQAFAHIAPTKNPFILVSGSARFEGAMIATVAQADRGRFYYVLRASMLLSSSSFTGTGYRQRFAGAADLKAWLVENQIGWIVIDSSPESMGFGHNGLLLAAAKNDPGSFRAVWKSVRPDGTITVFEMPASVAPPRHPDKLLAELVPSGVPLPDFIYKSGKAVP